MADDTEKKATVVDVTAEATEKAKKEEKIENKANDYKSFWEGINENERKMSNDTPNFHIYISHEKMDIYSEEIEEMDETSPNYKPPEERKSKDKDNDKTSTTSNKTQT